MGHPSIIKALHRFLNPPRQIDSKPSRDSEGTRNADEEPKRIVDLVEHGQMRIIRIWLLSFNSRHFGRLIIRGFVGRHLL